jgi:hypothetical protein
MSGVDEPFEGRSTPRQIQLDPCAQGIAEDHEVADRDAIDPPALDPGDLRPMETRTNRELVLRELSPEPKRLEPCADAPNIHGPMVPRHAHLPRISRFIEPQ